MKLLGNTCWCRRTAGKKGGEGDGDKYASRHDTQLIFSLLPSVPVIYPVNAGKGDPGERQDTEDGLQVTVRGNCKCANGCASIHLYCLFMLLLDRQVWAVSIANTSKRPNSKLQWGSRGAVDV